MIAMIEIDAFRSTGSGHFGGDTGIAGKDVFACDIAVPHRIVVIYVRDLAGLAFLD